MVQPSKLRKKSDYQPGPGSYMETHQKSNPQWFTISKRPRQPAPVPDPGPGSYTPNLDSVSPHRPTIKMKEPKMS